MLHTNFPPTFEIESNPELPGNGAWNLPERYIPESFKPGLSGHLILKIGIDGKKEIWHVDANENSEVWTMPGGEKILIAAQFKILCVSVKEPNVVQEMDFYSLIVTPIIERGLLILNDYFRVAAYSKMGLLWKTPRLVDDDLVIKIIDGGRLICSGFSLEIINEETQFSIDITTGAVLDNNFVSGSAVSTTKLSKLWRKLTQPKRF